MSQLMNTALHDCLYYHSEPALNFYQFNKMLHFSLGLMYMLCSKIKTREISQVFITGQVATICCSKLVTSAAPCC